MIGKIKNQFSLNEILPYGILCLYTIVMACLMVYWGNWTIGDDAIYLRTTALGNFNWCLDGFLPKDGRLFPLAHFDYNLTLLMPFFPSVKAHYLINAVSFCIYVFLLWWIIKKVVYSINSHSNECIHGYISLHSVIFFGLVVLVFSKKIFLLSVVLYILFHYLQQRYKEIDYRPWIVTIAIFSLLLQPMWSVDFFEIHTATRLFVVLAALFIWAIYRFLDHQKWSYALLALFATFYLTYSYEYHFGLFVVFATTMLLFYPDQTKFFKGLMWGIMGVALSFIIVYLCFIYPHIEQMYSHGNQSLAGGIANLLSWVKVYSFAIALGMYRIYAVLWKKDREHVFYDACLASGLAGLIALIVLGMFEPYCHMTNIVLCYIPVVYWMQKIFGSKCSLIFYSLLIIGLLRPYINTIRDRVSEMTETMPKVEQTLGLLDSNTKMFMIMPDNPNEMVADFSREGGCKMFMHRCEAILRYADKNHSVYNIEEYTIDDVSQLDEDIIYLANPDWIDDAAIVNALDERSIKISFGTIVLYK